MSDDGFEMDQKKKPLPPDEKLKVEFTVTNFQYGENHVHTRYPITESLLPLQCVSDQIAALALSVNILSFMGDLRQRKNYQGSDKCYRPIMARILSTLDRKYNQTDLDEAIMTNVELAKPFKKQVRVSKTEGRKSKRKEIKFLSMREKVTVAEESMTSFVTPREHDPLTGEILTSEMHQLQFIVGQGILRPSVRDETCCQITKQLTKNPSKASHDRGWTLLALCLGCFTPSEKINLFIERFIRNGPPPFAASCEERLRRTIVNGTRNQPPSCLELEAVKLHTPLKLPITLMDGSTRTLQVDSATTADEICQQLSDKIGVEDRFGFALFIAMDDKVTSLGSGGDHVFDAISLCEQIAKANGTETDDNEWRLFFKKEIFAPWHVSSNDPIATNLIYNQIVRGIKFGVYRCDKDDDLALIAAQQYYVDYGNYGSGVNSESLRVLIPSYIPKTNRDRDKTLKYWSRLIVEKIKALRLAERKLELQTIKEELLNYAKEKWQRSFSRYFEAYKFFEQGLSKNGVVIAVNSEGVYIVDDQEQELVGLSFADISDVYSSRDDKMTHQYVQLNTVAGFKYTLLSQYSKDIRNLVAYILDGLKKRSTYAVALRDYSPEGDERKFSFKKGELISLQHPYGDNLVNSGWCFGECNRNNLKGYFPSRYIHILPTITEPTQMLLNCFVESESSQLSDEEVVQDEGVKRHTLEQYAKSHFRNFPKRSLLQRVASFKRRRRSKLWTFSNETLKQPLLNNLPDNGDICEEVCKCFTAIQQYMGDGPRCNREPSELIVQIFGAALKRKVLRDEVYCQILKQLTENKNTRSEDRGWELMWLMTGCCIPSTYLLHEVNAFIRSSSHLVAQHCIKRLKKSLKYGERKFPPLQVEIEAVQQKVYTIFLKVLFPDESHGTFEVESNTRPNVLCKYISESLNLKSFEGFCLFVKIEDKVISVPESCILFDFISSLIEWKQKARSPINDVKYQVFFMKKLWTNTVPGRDLNADLIFHYHQELPKLLRGYHKCSREEAARLAALIFRVKFGEVNTGRQDISQGFKNLVPTDLVETLTADGWSNDIVHHYKDDCDLTQDDAKLEFLKLVYSWPLFGSTFFEIKQTSETGYPLTLYMAINRKAVHLIQQHTKHIYATYPLELISNWRGSDTHFNMTIGDLVRGSKVNFETTKGYEIDDVLSAYIRQEIMNENKEPD